MIILAEHWEEQKEFLRRNISYLKRVAELTTSKAERSRLRAKADGMSVALQHMNETERIYGG